MLQHPMLSAVTAPLLNGCVECSAKLCVAPMPSNNRASSGKLQA